MDKKIRVLNMNKIMKKIGCVLLMISVVVISVLFPIGIMMVISKFTPFKIECSIKSYVITSLSIASISFISLFIAGRPYTKNKNTTNENRKQSN